MEQYGTDLDAADRCMMTFGFPIVVQSKQTVCCCRTKLQQNVTMCQLDWTLDHQLETLFKFGILRLSA